MHVCTSCGAFGRISPIFYGEVGSDLEVFFLCSLAEWRSVFSRCLSFQSVAQLALGKLFYELHVAETRDDGQHFFRSVRHFSASSSELRPVVSGLPNHLDTSKARVVGNMVYIELFDEDTAGLWPGSVTDPGSQERVQRHIVEHLTDFVRVAPMVQIPDAPVPQMVTRRMLFESWTSRLSSRLPHCPRSLTHPVLPAWFPRTADGGTVSGSADRSLLCFAPAAAFRADR